MKYVFNPRNRQINPVTEMTFTDPTLRDKVVSAELYALVCKGKITIEDVAALFAVNKSPEVLLKNYKAIKESVVAKAPAVTVKLPDEPPEGAKKDLPPGGEPEGAATADAAFDGRELCKKTNDELLILAGMVGVDVNAPDFAPTRGNMIKAIMAKAEAAEAGKKAPEGQELPQTPPAE